MASSSVFVHFLRDRNDPRYVTFEVRHSWWARPSLAHPQGVTRSKVVAKGRFEHPDAVDDVDILIGELAQNLKPHPDSKGAHPSSVSPVRGEVPLPGL